MNRYFASLLILNCVLYCSISIQYHNCFIRSVLAEELCLLARLWKVCFSTADSVRQPRDGPRSWRHQSAELILFPCGILLPAAASLSGLHTWDQHCRIVSPFTQQLLMYSHFGYRHWSAVEERNLPFTSTSASRHRCCCSVSAVWS